jgi:hypothetical protein
VSNSNSLNEKDTLTTVLSYKGKDGVYDIVDLGEFGSFFNNGIKVTIKAKRNGVERQRQYNANEISGFRERDIATFAYDRIDDLIIKPNNVDSDTDDYGRNRILIKEADIPSDIQDAIDRGITDADLFTLKANQLTVSVDDSSNIEYTPNFNVKTDGISQGLGYKYYIDFGKFGNPFPSDTTTDAYITFKVVDEFNGAPYYVTQNWKGVEKKGGGGDVWGCTDPNASNYNPKANKDDGSCRYDTRGCTNPNATNYNPNATIDDGSCKLPEVKGCTDPSALNYNPNASQDDGTCEYDKGAPDIEGIIENSLKFSINDVVREYTPSTTEEDSNTLPITEKDRFLKYTIIDDKGNRNLLVNWVRGGELNQVEGEIDVLDSIVVKLANPINTSVERLDKVDIFNIPYYPLSIDFDLSKAAAVQKIEQLTPNFQTEVEEGKINEYSDYLNTNNLTLSSSQNIQKKVFDHFLQKDNQLVKLNTDFTDFKNFVKFSSAEERVINFHYKIQDIESYTSQSNVVSQSVASQIYKTAELNKLDEKIRNVKNSFDDYEYFLYNDSGSFYSSSYVSSSDAIYASWPKNSPTELISNGDFSTSDDWVISGDISIANQKLDLTDKGTATQQIELDANTEYVLTFDATQGRQFINIIYNGINVVNEKEILGGNSYNFEFIAPTGDSSNDFVIQSLRFDRVIKLDNISLKEPPSLQSSDEVSDWYESLKEVARDYDNLNRDSFRNNTPEHIREDENSEEYVLFVDMIGQLFDELWLYSKELGNLYDWNLDKTKGLSSDLSIVLLNMYANNLDSGFSEKDIWEYILGVTTDETNIGAVSNNFSFENQQKETIRRLLTNLPHLLKHKGTERAVRALVNSYGIPESTLFIKEFGSLKSPLGLEQEFKKETHTYELLFNNDDEYIEVDDVTISPFTAFELNYRWDGDIPTTPTTIVTGSDGSNGVFTFGIEPTSDTKGKLFLNINSGSQDLQVTSSEASLFDGEYWNILVQQPTIGSFEFYTYKFDRIFGEFDVQQSNTVSTSSVSITDTTQFKFGKDSTDGLGFSGAVDELRVWSSTLSENDFEQHTKFPTSVRLENPLLIPSDLRVRVDITQQPGTNLSQNGKLPNLVFNPLYPTEVIASNFEVSDFNSITREDYILAPNIGDDKLGNNKVRYGLTQTLSGDTLTPNIDAYGRNNESIEEVTDTNDLIIGFSPTDILNQIILEHFGSTDLVNEYGDPLDTFNTEYDSLRTLVENFFSEISSNRKTKFFIDYIRNFDKTLFNNIEKFVPGKSNLTTSIFIEPHLLDRSKAKRLGKAETANLANEGKQIDEITLVDQTDFTTFDNVDSPIKTKPSITDLERFIGDLLSLDLEENGQANVILTQDEVGGFLNQNTDVIVLRNSFEDSVIFANRPDEDMTVAVRNDRNERFVFEFRKFDFESRLQEIESLIGKIPLNNRIESNREYADLAREYGFLKLLHRKLFLIAADFDGTKPGVPATFEDLPKVFREVSRVSGGGLNQSRKVTIGGITYVIDEIPNSGEAIDPDGDIKLTVE